MTLNRWVFLILICSGFFLTGWSFVLHDIPDYLRMGYIEYLPVDMPDIQIRHEDHPTDLLEYSICQEKMDILFDGLNMDYPGLENARDAYQDEKYEEAVKELVKYFLERKDPFYFPDSFPENRPEPDPEYDTSEAQAVMEHYFDFSGITGNPGSPIDWDFMENDYLEWNFALNRLYFLYPLIMAYWNTHEEIYGNYAVEDLADWMIRGPSSYDRILEVSIRVATMLDAYFYLRHLDTFSADLQALFLLRMAEQGEILKNRIPSGGWRSHWWYAALLLSRMFPEFDLSFELLDLAEDIMEEFVDHNYYQDGYARTSSLMYHFFVESPHYLHLIDLYHLNDWTIPGQERLESIFSTYGQAHLPDYNLPLFGDGEQRSTGLLRAYMRKAAELLDCEKLLYLGTQGAKGILPDYTSVEASDSMLFFLRKSWEKESSFLGLNIGYGEGWHSHYDFLSFVYYMNGKELLRDSGIRSYEAEDRQRFRSSRMHNVPEIEGEGQEYNVDYPPQERGVIEHAFLSQSYDLVQARLLYPEIDGKRVTFTRRYFFLKEKDCLVVVDSFSDRDRKVTQYFQVGIEYDTVIPETQLIRMKSQEEQAYLDLAPFPDSLTMYYGSEDPFLGWYSEKFHDTEPAHTLALHYYSPLPANMIFLFTGEHLRPDKISVLQYGLQEGTWGMELGFNDQKYYILQNPCMNIASEMGVFRLQGLYAFMVVKNDEIIELEAEGKLFIDDIELQPGMPFPPAAEVSDFELFY